MAFLDKNGLQVLTNKLVQGDAIKVASHRGHTVKNVIDNITRECENISTPNTMNLENRVNEFKVGKGRDVDVSGDVEEGKIEVELQGKTWQNVVHGKKSVQNNIFTIEDGKYVFNNNTTSSGGIIFSLICKPNTTYTLIINFLECALGDNTIYIDGHPVYLSTTNKNLPKTKGTHAISFVTKDDVTDKKMKLAISSSSTSKLVIDENIIVLEGDYTQTPIEELPKYFEGIKSSFEDGIVDVEVQGKNLFDVSKLISTIANNVTISRFEDKLLLYGKINNSWTSFNTANTLSKGTYSLKIYNRGVYWGNKSKIWGYNSKRELIANVNNGKVFKIEEDVVNIKLVIEGFEVDSLVDAEVTVQIEKSSSPTSYEPYYKKKISFNIGEPLRILPNGVCDEIRNNNGQWELVRRTAKVILNGSENWDNSYSGWNNKVFCCPNNYLPNIKYAPIDVSNVLSTLLPPTNIGTLCSKLGNTGICTHAWSTKRLQVAKNGIETVEQLKSWLSENLMTVYYELETPIVTPIEPIEFEVKPLATMTINSEIAPTSNHKVILNRAGQIEQGIIQIAELKSRVDALETAYDSYLLETQHKLSILGFEYELESEEV